MIIAIWFFSLWIFVTSVHIYLPYKREQYARDYAAGQRVHNAREFAKKSKKESETEIKRRHASKVDECGKNW